MSDKQNTLIALYVHIPFCVRKCHYCDFNSFESESETIDSYLDSLGKEIDTLANQHTFTTIYIGGGTPTVLSVNQLRRLLHQLYSHALSPGVQEYTIEANPGTLTVDKVRLLKEYGIDRISLGVQSFRDEQLKFLGRIHSGIEAKNTFELLRNEGFKNINIDLIFGCPGQSLEDWEKDMQSAVTMNPEHISAYSLTYEEGTSLVERMENGMFRRLDEDIELEMYRSAMDFFQRNGYNHYEISNFARHGYECSHNQVYWNNNEYIGVGTGAFSFVNGVRSSNERDIEKYIRGIRNNKNIKAFSETLTQQGYAAETIIMCLRMRQGISKTDFYKRFGYKIEDRFGNTISRMLECGLIYADDKYVRLTEKGIFLANTVMTEFV